MFLRNSNLHTTLEHMNKSVEGRSVLTQSLAQIESKKRDSSKITIYQSPANDRFIFEAN